MFYPYYCALTDGQQADKGHPFLIGGIEKCDPGPHTPPQIADIITRPPCMVDDKDLAVFSWIPDEDFQAMNECDMYSIVYSKREDPLCLPLYWGREQKFRSPFIMCRNVDGYLRPWPDVRQVADTMHCMVQRQAFWVNNSSSELKSPIFDKLSDFIKDMNK